MPDFYTLRINEKLLGQIIAAKIRGTDSLSNNYNDFNKMAKIKSTINPDIKYKSFSEWYNAIHDDVKNLAKAKIRREFERQEMNKNIDYYSNWINNKFKRV